MSSSQLDSVPVLLTAADPELEAIRAILLEAEWARMADVEKQATQLQSATGEIQETITLLKDAYQKMGQAQAGQKKTLQEQIDHLEKQLAQQRNYFDQRLEQDFALFLGRAAVRQPKPVGKALSPVVADAIRQTIEREPEIMVKALSPILFRMIQQAISDSLRQLQERVDEQLRKASQPGELWRSFWARLRGIEPSERLMRDALPFAVEELFLIQQGAGLLLGHWEKDADETDDSELISGMLTAVREFVHDSFSNDTTDGELNELQYGNRRILIQNGRYAYLAVVVTGTHSPAFRFQTQNFLAQLNHMYKTELSQFAGNHDVHMLFRNELEQFAISVESRQLN